MSFPVYPAYKKSDVEWLGEVPEHWILTPLKHLALLNPRKSGYDGDTEQLCSFVPMEKLKTGVVQLDEERPVGEVIGGYTYFEDGDVLQAKVTPCFENKNIAIAKGLTNGIGFGSSEINVLRPYQGVNAEYLYYRVQEDSYMDFCTSSMIGAGGLKRVPTDVINNFKVATPEVFEQTQIARFLDHETARIDALIEEQQRLIELLKEKRQAVISHAVTKGLDPTVPIKDSGVQWLGEVPAHWVCSEIKRFACVQGGYAFPSDLFGDDGVAVIRIGDIQSDGSISIDGCKRIEGNESAYSRFAVVRGDLLMAMTGATIGKAGWYYHDEPAYLNQRVGAFRAGAELAIDFLYYITQSVGYQEHIKLAAFGGAQPNISDTGMLSYFSAFPPLEEQVEISRYLNNVLKRLSSTVTETEKSVFYLQERRSALISAAVTGKIDVRGWQPPVSTQAPESAIAEAN